MLSKMGGMGGLGGMGGGMGDFPDEDSDAEGKQIEHTNICHTKTIPSYFLPQPNIKKFHTHNSYIYQKKKNCMENFL